MAGITKINEFRYSITTNHSYAFMICGRKYSNLRKIGNKFKTYIRYNNTGIFDISLERCMNRKTQKDKEIALWDTINYLQYLERKNKTIIESFNNNNKYSIRDIAYILNLRHKFKTNKEFINTEYVSNVSVQCYCNYDQIEEDGEVCKFCRDDYNRRCIYNNTRYEFLNNN
jgi:hypothetical protein